MSEKVITIEPDGSVVMLHDDNGPKLGRAEIARASEVEPEENGQGWYVRLTDHPLNGVHKGKYIARHVPRRDEAIALEISWIQQNILAPERKD